jgi:hypothetical protein
VNKSLYLQGLYDFVIGQDLCKGGLSLNNDTLKPKKSDFLKIIAITAMLIDHVSATLAPTAAIYYPLRIIGRIAFPIFAYQLAVGYVNTRSITKYLSLLTIFAVISQIPYYLAFSVVHPENTPLNDLNIFFTLALGLIALYCYDAIGKNNFCKRFYLNALPAIAFAVIAQIFNTDYGAYGVIMIFVCYILRYHPIRALVSQSILTCVLICLSPAPIWQIFCLIGVVAVYMPFLKQGIDYPTVKINKYLFYSFYPLHLLALYLIHVYLI